MSGSNFKECLLSQFERVILKFKEDFGIELYVSEIIPTFNDFMKVNILEVYQGQGDSFWHCVGWNGRLTKKEAWRCSQRLSKILTKAYAQS